jgi:SAM-dependent methyltransferase
VTLQLARLAGAGTTVGVDVDSVQLDLARQEAAAAGADNVEFRERDVHELTAGDERFDVVYARFLLTHLTDPAAALANLTGALVPGGVLLVEDIDFAGHFCHPPSPAFDRYLELYTDVVRGRGCDPRIGPRLPSLLRDAGLVDVEACVVQPAGIAGEVRLIAPITLEAVADAVLGAGLCTRDELDATVDELYAFATTDGAFLSLPRVVQAWGRAPA